MEGVVRESGALPATIAVLQGRISVGVSTDNIEYLAARKFEHVRTALRKPS